MNITIMDGIYLGFGLFIVKIITWPLFAYLGYFVTRWVKEELKPGNF